MALVWVTGNSGTGKSTVRVELAERGYRSFDTDEDGITVWRRRRTGEQVYDPGAGNHPETWLEEHGWTINRRRVEQLAEMAQEETVFLCGSVENEHEVWDLFDAVVCLVLDEPTLRARIATRTTLRRRRAKIHPIYLLQYDDDLDGALGLVIHDLVSTGALNAADAGAQVRNRAAARIRFLTDTDRPDVLPEPASYTALLVAEELQVDLMEGLGPPYPRMVTWPPCPLHPHHPLWLNDLGADSAWTCPTTRRRIAELGQL